MVISNPPLYQLQLSIIQQNNSNHAHHQCTPLTQIQSIQDLKQIHAHYIKLGHIHIPYHASKLLSNCALSQWGSIDYAQSIFYGFQSPCTFDFNTMIRAHVNYGSPIQALLFYRQMLENAIKVDNFTFTFAIKACAVLSAIKEGMQIHGHSVKFGYSDDVYVNNGLINLYSKCEDIDAAFTVFDKMGFSKNAASLSTILAAFNRVGLWSECTNVFTTTVCLGIVLDESSLVSMISSCARLGMYSVGRSLHCFLMRNFMGLNVVVQTSIIDMYMKCGYLEKGLEIFDQISLKNEWTYSVVISGLAMHGEGEKALRYFSTMLREGIKPDETIYVGVLSACSHAGLVDVGLKCFDRMKLEHNISPNAQHYGCIVDLFGRAGKLNEACAVIQSMPTCLSSNVAWRSLLSACRVHENLELAEYAMKKLASFNYAKASDHIVLSGMYAKVGKWELAGKTRAKIIDQGLRQDSGLSQVEVRGIMHRFVSMDEHHMYKDEIYEMLYQIEWQLKFEGYKPDTTEVLLHDVEEDVKVRVVNGHSQKLAIAFGLLSISEGKCIRVVTNIKMSKECHTYTGMVSKIFEREILVRDRNRFHHFRQGVCSCKDYW